MIKILLVDDEREEREGIAFLIEKYKYPMKVRYAANGKDALDYIREHEVDILFTDVKMPIMNGLELAKIVSKSNPEIRIIIFSAYGEFEYAKQALEANAVSYLLKPIELDEFQNLMENVMNSINVEKEEKRFQEENEKFIFSNLLYKAFSMAKVNDNEKERIQKYLFEKENQGIILIRVEFMNNYFDLHKEEFVHFAKMYLGENIRYVELYPNEAILLLDFYKMMQGKTLEGQLRKLLRDVHGEISQDNQSMVIVSEKIYTLEELFEQQERIRCIQEETFGYNDKIVWVDNYYNHINHYDMDIEIVNRELLETIDTMDIELIRKENEKLIEALKASGKISKLYLQNMLYTNIKALYHKVMPENSETILLKAEQIFIPKELKSTLKDYRETIEQLLTLISMDKDGRGIVQQIKSIIEQECNKDIGLEYIAEKINLSPAYVSYLFKKESGQTLVSYITHKKMDKARKLLENRNLKVLQVAKACGYDNQSYFNKLFKNHFGLTPKQYRENL